MLCNPVTLKNEVQRKCQTAMTFISMTNVCKCLTATIIPLLLTCVNCTLSHLYIYIHKHMCIYIHIYTCEYIIFTCSSFDSQAAAIFVFSLPRFREPHLKIYEKLDQSRGSLLVKLFDLEVQVFSPCNTYPVF